MLILILLLQFQVVLSKSRDLSCFNWFSISDVINYAFVMPAGVGGAIYLVEFAKDTWHTRLLRRVIKI